MSISFVHEHTLLWPPSPPSSIWAISRRMAPVPLPTHQFPSNNSIFHQTLSISHQFFDFRARAHPIWLSPPTWGCHRPPQSTGHLSHPPAGPVPLSVPLPIDFYRFHTQSVHLSVCLSANPPTFQFRSVWHPHHIHLSRIPCPSTHPSVHLSHQ